MPIHTIFVVFLGQIFRCKTVFIHHTVISLLSPPRQDSTRNVNEIGFLAVTMQWSFSVTIWKVFCCLNK